MANQDYGQGGLCPACAQEIDDQTEACPYCGERFYAPKERIIYSVLVLVVFGLCCIASIFLIQ
ncbi:MAG: hypothetical protein PVF74_05510 [Anaerolineales bacterium]|jgi:predicted amidophosphoribosyltransferase